MRVATMGQTPEALFRVAVGRAYPRPREIL